MCKFMRSLVVAATCLASLTGWTAHAQTAIFDPTVTRPTGFHLPVVDWTFVAVVERGVNGEASVPGVLALYDKDLATGDNIVAVWYDRPTSPSAEWGAVSWSNTDQWSAIKWIKTEYNISDDFDGFWPTKDVVSSTPAQTPEVYDKGLVTMDPLAPIVAQPDRDAILALLTAAGYKSADIAIEKVTSCPAKYVLEGYSKTVEFAVENFGPGSTGWGVPQWNGVDVDVVVDTFLSTQVPQGCLVLAQAPVPVPVVPAVPVVPGTTRPQPGTPLNPGAPWQRETLDAPIYKPGCSTAISCCYEQKIIWLYTAPNWRGNIKIYYCFGFTEFSCPLPAGGACPAVPTCSMPAGPLMPVPSPPGLPIKCGFPYN